jgi:hypothetical protein
MVNTFEVVQYLTELAAAREEAQSPIRLVKCLTGGISSAVATGKGAT